MHVEISVYFFLQILLCFNCNARRLKRMHEFLVEKDSLWVQRGPVTTFVHCVSLTMSAVMVFLQESVKRLQDIQNSLIGQFEVIKPGRVSNLTSVMQVSTMIVLFIKVTSEWER